MEPRTYVIKPSAAHVTLHVDDSRESFSADDDLVELGLRRTDGSLGLTAAFSVAELERLRDVLTEIITRGHQSTQ